jgi:hypothetical protein
MSNPSLLKKFLIDADGVLSLKDPSTIHYRHEFVISALSAYFEGRVNNPEPFEGADEVATTLLDKVTTPL